MGLSISKLLLILLIVLVVFGAGKLPGIMGDIGKGMRALRDGLKDENDAAETTANKSKEAESSSQVVAELQVPIRESQATGNRE